MTKWRVALLMASLAFALLAALVFGTHEVAFEHLWSDPLRNLRSPFNNQLVLWVTQLGNGWFLAALCLAVSAWLKDPWERLALLQVYLLQLLGNMALKQFFSRTRPGDDFDPLVKAHFYSFPSGHSMATMAVFGFLAWLLARHGYRRSALALMFVPLLVGFTRVYLAVHYATDVLGGFLAGIVVVALVQLTRPNEGGANGDRNRPLG